MLLITISLSLYIPYSNLRVKHNKKGKSRDFRGKPGGAFKLLLDPG